jgi:hypothetical protein
MKYSESLNGSKISSIRPLNKDELDLFHGGSRYDSFIRWLGIKVGELFPCYCSTGIGYDNYQDYQNPNDPLL